jgi:hypothetical protein
MTEPMRLSLEDQHTTMPFPETRESVCSLLRLPTPNPSLHQEIQGNVKRDEAVTHLNHETQLSPL